MTIPSRMFLGFWVASSIALLASCASRTAPLSSTVPVPPAVVAASAPAAAPVVSVPAAAPGADALAQGLKAYQSAKYTLAEAQFKTALQAGLSTPADVANAHKHLAFIYCTSQRQRQCTAAFKAARAADPRFALTKAEAGHPMWGPVYRRALPPLKR